MGDNNIICCCRGCMCVGDEGESVLSWEVVT